MDNLMMPVQECTVPLPIDKGYRIIQIHPTLKCNLTCLHCYSSSAPQIKGELNLKVLLNFLSEARKAGYNAISLSGGEAFLYTGLHELLTFAKSIGYFISVTTNGMLFKRHPKNIEMLQLIDLLAFSIDGEKDYHNYIRNSPKAYDGLLEGIEIVKGEMESYGFIHTVTQKTFSSLLWLSDFAYFHKAKLLQLHPIENVGRGKDFFSSLSVEQDTLHRIYILFTYLKQKYRDEILLELNLLHRDHILEFPGIIYAQRLCTKKNRLTDHLRELILDETGQLLPISHGFSNEYAIGNIYESLSFNEMTERFLEKKIIPLQTLFDATFNEIALNESVELLNWAELIVFNSNKYAVKNNEAVFV